MWRPADWAIPRAGGICVSPRRPLGCSALLFSGFGSLEGGAPAPTENPWFRIDPLQTFPFPNSSSEPRAARLAIRAPSAIALSLAQTTSSVTRPMPAEVSKPQSVPAMHPVRVADRCATRSSRSATTSGCSTKPVRSSMTPATMIWSSASGIFLAAPGIRAGGADWRRATRSRRHWPFAGSAGCLRAARRGRAAPRNCPSRHAAAPGRAAC